MGLALKKHLSKLELKSTDIVIFSVPLGAKDEEWRGFAEGLAEDLKANHGITTPLLVIRPGFHLDKLDEATLAEYGLVKLERKQEIYSAIKKLHGRVAVHSMDSPTTDERDNAALKSAVEAVKTLGLEWGSNEYE